MPFRLHHASRQAGHQEPTKGQRPTTSRVGQVISGLALPTAAVVALMLMVSGVAVATSSTPGSVAAGQSQPWRTQNAIALPEPTAAEPAEIRARDKEVAQQLARTRAATVARSLQRKRLAARVQAARHAALAHSWRLPITNPVKTSGFGYRWGNLHAGEDFGVSSGTPLASMSTGTVAYASEMSGFGNLVQIRYWDGTISYFGHMSVISVSVGQAVDPGQIVGESGNTGHSTGPHLHLEIHPNGGSPIDPLPWLAEHHVAT